MSTDQILEFRDVGFSYPNGLWVLDNISITIPRGSITAVVGPSGCGKSTLLRLAAQTIRPSTGELDRHLLGVDERGEHRHPCAMVFQEDTLLPWLKVRHNVELSARVQRRRGPAVRARTDELLRMVGLQDFVNYFPSKLS